ncbi:hypothetical protein BC938DRAFT_470959 [Jimgerdemannia flammicorona]|uniref:GST N-terminal domain-containing protein n=1 Tax=Jimgerdemannia flammicorona TaxID=994334 RepID=A0A433Q913_9FUNG|nr:hypothetical protein BC938DRAFT_470959 [Jimgerdemannia flammicorona]
MGVSITGSIPVLHIGDKHLTQSTPIIKYLGQELGKYLAKNIDAEFYLEQFADIANDWRVQWIRLFENNEDFNKKYAGQVPTHL